MVFDLVLKGFWIEKETPMFLQYSLCSNMIVPPPGFCPKMIVRLICPARNLRLKSQIISHQTFIMKKTFDNKTFNTATFEGGSEWLLFFYFKSHTYNYTKYGI